VVRGFIVPPGEAVNAHVILTAEDIRRAIRRIAHEIIERNRDLRSIVLVGLHTRGVPLAERLATAIAEFEGQPVPSDRSTSACT